MNWHHTKCLTSIKANEDLGLKSTAEFLPCTINLDEIAAFFFDEDEEGNECTQIKFKSGDSFSVQESYDQFTYLMSAKLYGNK